MSYGGLRERQCTTTREDGGSFGTPFGAKKPEEQKGGLTGKLTATKTKQRSEPQKLERIVLVADDDVGYRQAICRFLTFRGYATNEAGTADELIARARQGTYYAIITDNRMKDGHENSGLYAIAEMRKRRIKTPIIFTTGDLTQENEAIARQLGANDVLKKPIRIADLLDVLEKYATRT